MEPFTEANAREFISKHLKDWKVENNAIHRDFKFKTFVEAFAFMTKAAFAVEKANHHPDWFNSYNKVKISLTSHDKGGITQKDFDLATQIDALV